MKKKRIEYIDVESIEACTATMQPHSISPNIESDDLRQEIGPYGAIGNEIINQVSNQATLCFLLLAMVTGPT